MRKRIVVGWFQPLKQARSGMAVGLGVVLMLAGARLSAQSGVGAGVETPPSEVAAPVAGTDAAEPGMAEAAAPLDFLFTGSEPGSVAQLRAMQERVRNVAERVFDATVNIQMGDSQGTGVIVTSDGYVLTAAHVVGRPGTPATVVLRDGTRLKARALGVNRGVDSGMLKIEDPAAQDRSFPYLDLGESSSLPIGAWVMAIGHPGGLDPRRGMVVRVGRLLTSRPTLLRTECVLVGGDSGGPLVDMNGNVIGIHSRIGGNLWENIHVPVDQYSVEWDQLIEGAVIGGSGDPFIGMSFGRGAEGLRIRDLTSGGPAERAGLRPGDLIIRVDTAEVHTREEFRNIFERKKAGDSISITVKRGEEELTFDFEVGEE